MLVMITHPGNERSWYKDKVGKVFAVHFYVEVGFDHGMGRGYYAEGFGKIPEGHCAEVTGPMSLQKVMGRIGEDFAISETGKVLRGNRDQSVLVQGINGSDCKNFTNEEMTKPIWYKVYGIWANQKVERTIQPTPKMVQ